jgi:hypothetical protein
MQTEISGTLKKWDNHNVRDRGNEQTKKEFMRT